MRIHAASFALLLLWAAASTCQARVVKIPVLPGEETAPSYAPQSVGPLGQPGTTAPLRSVSPNAPPVSAALQQGLAYLNGLDRQQDFSLAGKLMMKAWSQGDKYSAAGVALCHALGCYGTPDARSVQLWIERARRIAPAKAKLLEWHWANLAAQSNPQELLAGMRFKNFVDQLLREFDLTIFDTTATNTCTDAQRVATVSGYSLVVARKHKSHVKDVTTLANLLRADRSMVVGTVLNDF